jgi:TPR repeat protein
MTVSRKLAVTGFLVLGIAGFLLGLRSYIKHAAEQKKVRDLADRTRIKADQGTPPLNTSLRACITRAEAPGGPGRVCSLVPQAADQGYAKAEFSLGDLDHRGEGLPKDGAEAVR